MAAVRIASMGFRLILILLSTPLSMSSVSGFPALAAGFPRLLGSKLMRGALLMRGVASLTPGFARLFGIELVRSPLLMGSLTRLSRLLRIELMSGTLLMRGFSALAGYFPLLVLIH